MEKIINVAQYVFEAYKKLSGEVIDEMKLHKLLYFAQRESLAITNEPLFDGEFEGWKYGPVCREIRNSITPDGILDTDSDISEESKYIVNNIVVQYGPLASWKLSELSHKETSWKNARIGLADGENGSVKIKLDDIRADARKIRPYDTVWDMFYDEFEDAYPDRIKNDKRKKSKANILSMTEIESAIRTLLKKYNAEYAMLFGSYARGEATPESDVDVIIFGGEKFIPMNIFALGEDLREILHCNADVFEIREVKKNTPFYDSIFRDGIKIA